ncbi:MAG: glycosyltransferase family 1 protein [Patescibacteria group bacterium]|jgi:glycosyltransferase involved in cell wall biosynthesis
MRIGVDIRTLMDAKYSGVSLHNFNLITAMTKLDNDNHYRLYYNSFKGRGLNLPDLRKNNIEIIRSKYPNRLLNYVLFKIFKRPWIDETLKADIYLMPHINFIALSGRAKSILIVHDLSFLRHKDFFSFRKNIWHKFVNARKLVKNFDRIVAVSESTKNDIAELCGIHETKIKVIYPGVGREYRPLEKNHPRLKRIREKYGLPEKFILSLGTLEPRKNIPGLIRAFDLLKKIASAAGPATDCELVIAGGKGWKAGKILEEFSRAAHKRSIRFLGYVPENEKVYLYNLASVFAFPSFYEGFGFPPLEAMASGVPVVAGFSSSLPEITGGAALMVDPYDVNDIKNGLREALSNTGLREKLIVRGLIRAKFFSWEKCAREYLGLFEDDYRT